MSLIGTYDTQNVFARIIRGELPSYRIYEDDGVLAFLDMFPQSVGHTLVVPKLGEARNLLELDDTGIAGVFAAAKKVMKLLVEELQPDGVQLMQFNGGVGGQSVFHVHVHLVPRWPGQALGLHAQQPGDPVELQRLADRLCARASAMYPATQ